MLTVTCYFRGRHAHRSACRRWHARISLMWHFTNSPESCWSPWCQSTSEEDEFEDNRQMDKSHNMLPLTHPPTSPASTSCPHPQSFQTLPRANHKPVSIAMGQLSSVIKLLAACRMKEDQKGVKSCAGELGGGNILGWGTCRVGDGELWSGQIVT